MPTADHHRALTSFVADDDGTFNYAEPLAARRGIMLMQLVPRTLGGLKRMARARAASHLLGLCNPAIVTAADSSDLAGIKQQAAAGRFELSQLLLITITNQIESDVDYAYLRSYSAETCSWSSSPTMCLDGSRFSMVGERSAVVHRGAAHWLCIDRPFGPAQGGDECLLYKLSAGVGTTAACTSPHVSLAKTPICGAGSPQWRKTEKKLRYGQVER